MFLRGVFLILALCCAGAASAQDKQEKPVVPDAGIPSTSPLTPADEEPVQGFKSNNDSEYAEVTWPNLLRAMVRFNALDLHDEHLIDEYAAVTDCEIYKFYYKDDFKWNEIRKKIRESIDVEMANFPAHFYFVTSLRLDRYDFDRKTYRFTPGTAIYGVNVFSLFETDDPMCDVYGAHFIPKKFQALADEPFTMSGLPLPPSDAQAILRQMDADKNGHHIIYAKLFITVAYIERWRKVAMGPEGNLKNLKYGQVIDHPPPYGTLRLNVHLDSINFYEDEAMTKLIYTVKP